MLLSDDGERDWWDIVVDEVEENENGKKRAEKKRKTEEDKREANQKMLQTIAPITSLFYREPRAGLTIEKRKFIAYDYDDWYEEDLETLTPIGDQERWRFMGESWQYMFHAERMLIVEHPNLDARFICIFLFLDHKKGKDFESRQYTPWPVQ